MTATTTRPKQRQEQETPRRADDEPAIVAVDADLARMEADRQQLQAEQDKLQGELQAGRSKAERAKQYIASKSIADLGQRESHRQRLAAIDDQLEVIAEAIKQRQADREAMLTAVGRERCQQAFADYRGLIVPRIVKALRELEAACKAEARFIGDIEAAGYRVTGPLSQRAYPPGNILADSGMSTEYVSGAQAYLKNLRDLGLLIEE